MPLPPFSQNREFTRVPVLMAAVLTSDAGVVVEGHIHDLSARGVLFAGNGVLPEDTMVALDIYPHGRTEGVVIRAKGRVERCTTFGHGVEFLEFDTESWQHIQHVVYLHAEHPDVVREEFESHHGLRRKRDTG